MIGSMSMYRVGGFNVTIVEGTIEVKRSLWERLRSNFRQKTKFVRNPVWVKDHILNVNGTLFMTQETYNSIKRYRAGSYAVNGSVTNKCTVVIVRGA